MLVEMRTDLNLVVAKIEYDQLYKSLNVGQFFTILVIELIIREVEFLKLFKVIDGLRDFLYLVER